MYIRYTHNLQYLSGSEEAEFYLERTVAMAKKRPFVDPLVNASLYTYLAEIYTLMSDARNADYMYHLYRARVEADYGLDHLATSDAYNLLASVYTQLGKYAQALEYCNKALVIRINQLGQQHKSTADSHYNLGLLHRLNGNVQEAKRAFGFALDIRTRVFGSDSLQVAEVALSIGFTEHQAGRLEYAHKQYEIAFVIRATQLGPTHMDSLEARKLLDAVRLVQGRAMYKFEPGKHRLAHLLTSVVNFTGTLAKTFELERVKTAVSTMVKHGNLSVEVGNKLVGILAGQGDGNFSTVQIRACAERVSPGIAVGILQHLTGGDASSSSGGNLNRVGYDMECKSADGSGGGCGDTRLSSAALQATIDILGAQAVLRGQPPVIPDHVAQSIVQIASGIEGGAGGGKLNLKELRASVPQSNQAFLDLLIQNVEQHSNPGGGGGGHLGSGFGSGTGSGDGVGIGNMGGSGSGVGMPGGKGSGGSENGNGSIGPGGGAGGNGSGGAVIGTAANGSRTKQVGLSGSELWSLFNSRVGALGVIPMLIHDERARVAKLKAEADAQARRDTEEKEEGSKPKSGGLAAMFANKANGNVNKKPPPSGPKSGTFWFHC
jgi:tetratricopeptide (TPR) repeat protein